MSRTACPFAPDCPLLAGGEPYWRYCPKCGTRAQELVLPVEIDPAVEDEDGFYRMPLDGADTDLEIVPKDLDGIVSFHGVEKTPFGFFLKMNLSSLQDGEPAHILIESADERRTSLWESRPKRSRPVRLVRRVPKTSIATIPGVAIYLGEAVESHIELENQGFTSIRIGPPRVPVGFELSDPMDIGGFEIAPGDRRPVKISRKIGARPAELVFATTDDVEVASVRLLPVPAPDPRTPPGLVVSIDFGTSNTSVFCLETRTGIVEPIHLMGDGKERRETVLYAPDNVDPRNWQAFSEGVLGKDITRNLKTLVREQSAGSTARLEFYLQAILNNGISSYLEGRNPGDERTVEFVFTIPVLDGLNGENHIRYRETLLEAARTVGFEDRQRGWKVRSMLEPDGGALEVISMPEISQRIADGERILILDVGGGTTDVTLGRVRLVGRPHLEEIENVGVLANDDQFGGEMATYVLGWRWVKSNPDGILPEGPDRSRIGSLNEQIKTKNLVDYGWLADQTRRAEAEDWVVFDEVFHHPAPDNWERRFSDLWVQMRNAKHQLSDDSAKWVGQAWKVSPHEFDSRKPGEKLIWRVPLVLLESALEQSVQDIRAGIEKFLQERNIPLVEIKHVAMIGGSARLQPLRAAMAKLFPNRLLPLGSYVDVAVCRGGSRLYQAPPPILPIGFELVIGDSICLELAKPGASLAKVVRRIQPLEVSRGTTIEAFIRCVLPDGTALPYIGFKFENGFAGEIIGSVSSGSVKLAAKSNSGEIREYEARLS